MKNYYFFISILLLSFSCVRGGSLPSSLSSNDIDLASGKDTFVYVNNPSVLTSRKEVKKEFDVNIDNAIRYANYDDKEKGESKLLMDIYRPETDEKAPLIVYIHGGAFISGRSNGYVASKICYDLASKGFVVASINYRLIGDASLEDGTGLVKGGENLIRLSIYNSLIDINAAIRFLAAQKTHYQINTDEVFLAGYSAGAIAALHYVHSSEQSELEEMYGPTYKRKGNYNKYPFNGQSEPYNPPFQIRGMISLAGAMLIPNHIDARDNIPALLIHSRDDDMVPYTAGRPFDKFVKDYEWGLPGLYYELGITQEIEEGKKKTITFGGINISFRIPETFVELIRDTFTSEIYGSKSIYDSCQGKCLLVTIENGGHVFMRDSKNDYTQCYYDILDVMVDFVNLNTRDL